MMHEQSQTPWARVRSWLGGSSEPLARLAKEARAAVPEGDPEALLALIARSSAVGEAGILGPERGRALEDMASEAGSEAHLQLGAGTGEGAIRLARTLAAGSGRLMVVDPSPVRCRWLEEILRHASLSDHVELLPYSPLDAIPSLHRQLDLILLRHEPDLFLADLRHAERHGRVGAGARVVADLAGLSSTERADYLAHVRESGLYESSAREGFEVSRSLAEIEAW
jgi:predicted O-methyltransferase YrrM